VKTLHDTGITQFDTDIEHLCW